MRSAITPRPVFRIVHLESWDRPPRAATRWGIDPTAELDRLEAALAAVEVPDAPSTAALLRLYVPAHDDVDRAAEQVPAAKPAGPDRLPEMRVRFAKRHQEPGDRPFGRVAALEANLERLVAELEAEVDRLEDASSLAVGDFQPST
ncbi:MAG: hypothetical protein AB7O68_21605 [Pirellulales bacterium]